MAWNQPEAAARALDPFCRYLLNRSWYQQGAELMAAAAARFSASAGGEAEAGPLSDRLRARQEEFQRLMGSRQQSGPILESTAERRAVANGGGISPAHR